MESLCSGIGKSLFLIYFIYRFRSDERFPDKRFALEFFKGKYQLFKPIVDNDGGTALVSTILNAAEINSKDFLLLCDISE
jgi:hypothetical protein